MERYIVNVTFVKFNQTKEGRFNTVVEISPEDPFTDVSDIAHERCCEEHGDIEIIDEDIKNG